MPTATAELVAPALVTVHVWRVPRDRVPAALRRVATDRLALRRVAGLRFAKVLGTSSGASFAAPDADPRRWAVLSCWDDVRAARAFEASRVARGWRRISEEEWRVDLAPLSATGRWSRRRPFGEPRPRRWTGRVAAITRARLAPSRAVAFWRAAEPVARDLRGRAGLLATFGIGEAPLGWQGTFSAWRSAEDLRAFAYDGAVHAAVIRRTAETGWYAEELFARFGVVGAAGSLDGKDPLACSS
jgi:hypothetical protein